MRKTDTVTGLEESAVTVRLMDDIAVFTLRDATLMADQALELQSVIEREQAGHRRRFIFDLSRLDYISSEGLGCISKCWEWCRSTPRARMSVTLPRNDDNTVVNMFKITRMDAMIGSAIQFTVTDSYNYLRNF